MNKQTYTITEQNNRFQDFLNQAFIAMKPTENDINTAYKIIYSELKTYMSKSKLDSMVLGVSGGLDSALIAAIASRVAKDLGINLIGVSIPLTSSNEHREQATWVGNTYCTKFMEMTAWEDKIDINGNDTMYYINKALSSMDSITRDLGITVSEETKKVMQGNTKARMRMISLYNIARASNGLVLSTDNQSEGGPIGIDNLSVGQFFFTKHGDVGDWGGIQSLNKGFEVPAMARMLGVREDIITQEPSDGLNVSTEDTDKAQLGGHSYPEVDAIMHAYRNLLPENVMNIFEEIKNMESIQFIINRHNSFSYKKVDCVNISRRQTKLPMSFK